MEARSFSRPAVPAALWLALTLMATGLSPADAQLPVGGGKRAYENYDARGLVGSDDAAATAAVRAGYRVRQLTGARASAVAGVTRGMTRARASLQAAVPTLQIENNSFGTASEIIGTVTAGAFLTGASAAPHEATLRGFLTQNSSLYGVTPAETAALVKFADYANPAGNLSWVGLKQLLNGLPVFQGEIQAAFTADGALARTTGNLVAGLDASSLPVAAVLTPAQAVAAASRTIGHEVDAARLTALSTEEAGRVTFLAGGPYVRATRTELVYFPLEPGVATLAYSMVLWENVNAFYILVDANDSTLLWRKNITQDQTQTATYNVYTGVSPTPLTPSTLLPGQGTQPPEVARVNVTLIADSLTASPLGWLTDGTNTTVGNNVKAGIDVVAPNGIDTGGNVTGANRVFSFDYNPAPGLAGAAGSTTPSDANYRNGIVTNLFFWTNRYHDWIYSFGFTEAARNFQTTNTFVINGVSTNRGGSANDPILAESQDYSGTNNANFSTPADGSSGRMQMYLFTTPTPQRDGSLDTDVFVHEMTHGTSNRLHNNGSGLTTTQAGGMGEGWSDYYARCLLSRADEDVTGLFPSGGYVTYYLSTGFVDNYYYGIREFPYAVKSSVGGKDGKPFNPLTFGVLDLAQTNGLSNGAYPSSPVIGIYANEVHNIGHFWCTTLLEMRARLIQRLGYDVGNKRAVQIVTDGMKGDGTDPTLLVARDSIIAADNASYAGEDVADIRSAFATRGMGAGATITGTTYFTVNESFYPASVAGAITFSDSLGNGNGVADAGEDLVFTIPLTNKLTTADNNVTARLASYSATYGTIAARATATQTFAYHVPNNTAAGTLLQIPFTVTGSNGTANVTVPVRVGTLALSTVLSETFDGTAAGSLPAGWTQTGTVTGSTWSVSATTIDSGRSAFAADVASASDSSLVSPVVVLNGANVYQLSFSQRYTTEAQYDGGALEISIDGGAFTDIIAAGGTWVRGGYGYNVRGDATGNPLIGRRVWGGSLTATGNVVVNLPQSFVGNKNVQLRWRMGCDSAASSTGWFIDTVVLYPLIYSNNPIDSDGDGIPDGYETAHGLNAFNPADASADSDGDGVSNLQEYLAGTDPQSAASTLKVTGMAYNASGGLTVTFPTVNGKIYQLEYKNDLTAAAWTTLPGTYRGDGTVFNIIYSPADLGGQPKRFYRVRVTGQ